MLNQFSRTELLLGKSALERLAACRVAVFGIGGVGGYVCEALARSGVGAFDLVDDDKICLTNINRQIIATGKTVGKYKADVMKERILEINPQAQVITYKCFFLPENAANFPFERYDYVVDAVDTVTAKVELVLRCQKMGVPIISSMGAGNKLDGSAFRVADVYETTVDPLARVMRQALKKRGVKKLKVVYSGKTDPSHRGYGHQLPRPLHLSSRNGTALHRPQRHPRQRSLRALRGRVDHRRRSGQRSGKRRA